MNFDFSYQIQVTRNLPIKLRRVFNISVGVWLLGSIRYVHNNFLAFRDLVRAEMKITSEVMVLEAFLNSKYGPGIFINGFDRGFSGFYLFFRTESLIKTTFFRSEGQDALYIKARSENLNVDDFVVYVPIGQASLLEIAAIVNKYKISGKQYSIIFY